MAHNILNMIGLSVRDQESIRKTTGTIKSVTEFLIDIKKAAESAKFFDSIKNSVPWWLQATGESVIEAAPFIKFVANLLSKLGQIRDPDRLAYLAFTIAYQRCVEKALLVVGPPSSTESISQWEPHTEITFPDEGMEFNTYSLNDPLNHRFLSEANTLLNSAMDSAGFDKSECRRILNEVQMRFPGVLKSILTHPSTRDKFAALSDMLRLGNKEERVYSAWQDHFEYQRFLFEDKLVFGEEPFSLADIYVETDCGVLKCEELYQSSSHPTHHSSAEYIDPFVESFGGRNPLIESVMNLIGNDNFKDAIVVQGPAGSGKSVFTLRLCVELLRQGLKPIRIRFRDLTSHFTNIEDALSEAVRFWDIETRIDDLPHARPDELFLDLALFDQAIKFKEATICPWVLILDGWDEVSIAVQKGFAVRVGEILSQLRDRFLSRGNRPPIRVILTGRPSDAVSSSTFMSKQTRILTIRPFKPEQLEQFIYRLAEKLADPENAENITTEHFKGIIDGYAENFQTYLERKYELDTDYRLRHMEVLGLPLLTHLAVRLMVRFPTPDLQTIIENPTTLFRLLTDMTCEKGGRYGGDVHEPVIPDRDIRKLLHETAVAITTFGRDSIPYNELDLRLSQLNEDLVEEVQRITGDHPITSLMINFFFKGGHRELGAEFLHKSFREFLFAEAIIETLKNYGRTVNKQLPERDPELYWKDFEPTDPRYDFSRKIGKLLSAQWISIEVGTYIEDLIAWELSRVHCKASEPVVGVVTAPIELESWEHIRDGLADLWDWWGEGVHLRPQPRLLGKKLTGWKPAIVEEFIHWSMPQDDIKGQIPAPVRSASMDAHFGEALFRLAVLTHHYIAVAPNDSSEWQEIKEIDSPPPNAPTVRRYQSLGFRNGVLKVRFRPSGQYDRYFFNYIARINSGGWYPGTVFPSGLSLQSIDLENAFLPLIGLADCNLQDSTFRSANLTGAFLRNSNLTNANFNQCHSTNACFDGCITNRTRFFEMCADGSTFIDVDLSKALGADEIIHLKDHYFIKKFNKKD